MRLSLFILGTAGILASAHPAAAQGRSLDLAAAASPIQAPYGIGRPSPRHELSAAALGSRFLTGSAPAAAAPLAPGVRADGERRTVCPMPVAPAQGDSSPMPMARIDSTTSSEAMPLAPAGCVNR